MSKLHSKVPQTKSKGVFRKSIKSADLVVSDSSLSEIETQKISFEKEKKRKKRASSVLKPEKKILRNDRKTKAVVNVTSSESESSEDLSSENESSSESSDVSDVESDASDSSQGGNF